MKAIWVVWSAVLLAVLGCNPTKAGGDAAIPISPTLMSSSNDMIRSMARAPKPDTRTPEQLEVAACTSPDGHWWCKAKQPPKAMAATGPIFPSSWTVPTWYVDPANSSGSASDQNGCTTTSTPCLSIQEITVHRFGCFGAPSACPRWTQNTIIHQMSTQASGTGPSGSSDILYLKPSLENATAVYQCDIGTGQTVSDAGVIGDAANGFLAKDTGAPGQILTVPGQETAPFQLVKNLTGGKSSYAWGWNAIDAGLYAMTQPIAPIVPPVFPNSFTEVNTWAPGDSIAVYAPSTFFLGDLEPVVTEINGSSTNYDMFVYHCAIGSPGGAFGGESTINTSVSFVESTLRSASDQVLLVEVPGTSQGLAGAHFNNVFGQVTGGPAGGMLGVSPTAGGQQFVAGILERAQMSNVSLSGDTVLSFASNITMLASTGQEGIGGVYIDTGTTLELQGAFNGQNTGRNALILWGPGTLNLVGPTRFAYPSGASQAVATLKNAILQIGGQSLACLQLPGTTGDTCNEAVTATNFDAVLGATSGCLCAGTGCFCNYGP